MLNENVNFYQSFSHFLSNDDYYFCNWQWHAKFYIVIISLRSRAHTANFGHTNKYTHTNTIVILYLSLSSERGLWSNGASNFIPLVRNTLISGRVYLSIKFQWQVINPFVNFSLCMKYSNSINVKQV